MKSLLNILLFLLLLTQIHFPQWTWQNPLPQGNTLNSVKFISTTEGWTVGEYGTIISTTNGGLDWTVQKSGTSHPLNDVDFTDTNIGTAVGAYGTILRTTDGGQNWSSQTSGTNVNLYDVSFTNANVGSVVGASGTILRTTNGGLNWNSQTSGTSLTLNGVSFTTTDIGTIVGASGTILRTTNGGQNWSSQSSPTGYELKDVVFVDENIGTAIGGPDGAGRIIKTTNGGQNWFIQTSTGIEPFGVSFSDANNGIVVGYTFWDTRGEILRTTNGGNTWTQQTTTLYSLNGVSFIDANNAIVVGNFGEILKTINAGTTWDSQLRGSKAQMWEIDFTDVNNGWAAGAGGTIINTTNGGINWILQSSGITQTITDIYFLDSNNGFAVSSNGVFLATTNGGTNWIQKAILTTNSARGVFFTDENNGVVVGDFINNVNILPMDVNAIRNAKLGIDEDRLVNTGVIHITTNGGTDWIQHTNGTWKMFYDVFFTDSINGWAVGNDGEIVKTTNGGIDWIEQTSGTASHFRAVFFLDVNIGWAVGGLTTSGGTILKTTDGGSSWVEQSNGVSNELIQDIDFKDSNNGWASCSYGDILRTTDGGTNWILQPKIIGATIFGQCFITENTGWIVGSMGTIIKYSNEPVKALTLSSPNGGEIWKSGWHRNITWTSEYITNVNLYYSTNGGSDWNTIATGVDATSGSYDWTIPILTWFINLNCKVKIEDASNSSVYDESDNNFIIWHLCNIIQYANLGQRTIDFLETNIDISLNVTTSDNISVTYYPYETPLGGTLPSGVVVLSDYYWQAASTNLVFSNGKMIVPISSLRGVTDASKLVWLKRTSTGNDWENIGGIVSGDNLESTVPFSTFSEFAIGSTDPANPLPVELYSFEGTADGTSINLKWKTKTEVKNYGFEIERCLNNSWKKIGFVQGHGNSNSPKSYSFMDNNPFGGSKFLYRLRQIDTDGQFEYSDAIEVDFTPTTFTLYQNYPNPFNPSTMIRYQLPKESRVVLKIYDILGTEVDELVNEAKEPGIYEVEINANSLSSGTYIYRVVAGEFSETKKMVLMK